MNVSHGSGKWIIAGQRANRGANTGTDPDHQDGITIPLYYLVYHDAVVGTSAANSLRGFLYGDAPQVNGRGQTGNNLEQIRGMAALHKRVGLLEMTNHEFLDKNYRKKRATFADGTTVTVDWDRNTVTISPELAKQ